MKQIIEGLKYLSNKNIMHRQIALDNILINYDDENDREKKNIMKGTIKIFGFGAARYLKKGELAGSIVGNPMNMSPILLKGLSSEHFKKNVKYNEKEDVWSLGAICYELLMGKNAFDSKEMEELVIKMNKGDYLLPTTLSKEIVSFISCMLQFESDKRPSFDELSQHAFLKKNANEFKRIDFKILENETLKIYFLNFSAYKHSCAII